LSTKKISFWQNIPVGVRGTRIFVLANGLSNIGLSEGGRERNLHKSAAEHQKKAPKITYSLNHSTGDGVVGAASVNSQCAEAVHWRGGARRGVDGVLGDRHCGFWAALKAIV
jgi:hypothetical protein